MKKSSMTPFRMVAIAFFATACSTHSADPATTHRAPPSEDRVAPKMPRTDPQKVPLFIQVQGPESVQPGDIVDVHVLLHRNVPIGPIDLQISLPDGVDVLAGIVAESIVETDLEIRRTLTIRVPHTIPADGVKAVAQVRGESFGVTAKGEYSFGRPPEKLPQPVRETSPVKIHGFDHGTAIPLGE